METEQIEKLEQLKGLNLSALFGALVESVEEDGLNVTIDLVKKKLWIDGKLLVDGDWNDKRFGGTSQEAALITVESLYDRYKHSVPSERSERKKFRHGCQFKALDLDELDNNDFMYGERRDIAQAKLEMYILFSVLSGQLEWKDEWGTWFWKSPKDRDCVLLKDWFTTKNKETT